MIKSDCCNATIKAVCNDEYPDEGSTWYNICESCQQPCSWADQLKHNAQQPFKQPPLTIWERIKEIIKR